MEKLQNTDTQIQTTQTAKETTARAGYKQELQPSVTTERTFTTNMTNVYSYRKEPHANSQQLH